MPFLYEFHLSYFDISHGSLECDFVCGLNVDFLCIQWNPVNTTTNGPK